jgi:uncharacterized protein (DUF2235 family)
VQCLAQFISETGLLEKQHLYYLRGLFTLWANKKVRGGQKKLEFETERLKSSGLLYEVKITACAVWDTVSTLGFVLQLPPKPLSFVGLAVPEGVTHAFQALSLDEGRTRFRPRVWKTSTREAETVSQCWFLGSHGDVGGNEDAALGAITLLWMVGKLHTHVGVAFDDYEIKKHLKHKFLEWDFEVCKLFGTFKETRTLSTMPHTGKSILNCLRA